MSDTTWSKTAAESTRESLDARNAIARLRTALEIARVFIAEELEVRETSFVPGPDPEEQGYITSAREALAAVDAALNQEHAPEQCRYAPAGCNAPATQHCEQCGRFYCEEHALRHDRMVLEEFAPIRPGGPDSKHAILAKPISDKGAL
jgi:hypothetical protein